MRDLDRHPMDCRLSPPDWFVRLALHGELSLLETLALWLHYCDASTYEIAVVLSRKERGVTEALGRAQRKIHECRTVTIDIRGELVDALRDRLRRECAEVLAMVRNEVVGRGGTPGDGKRLPRVREVTVEDLVEGRLARLVGPREN